MITEIEIKARIIRKLVKWRKWGGSHTENVLSGLPSHLRGEKITKNVLRWLVKDGNYLNYYHQMNEKQKEYLLETEKIDSDIERISPILYRRLFAKREQLLKNKRLL